MDKLTIELDRMDARTMLHGLTLVQKHWNQKIKRAKKRGFKDHEAAELAKASADITELLDKFWKQYQEAFKIGPTS